MRSWTTSATIPLAIIGILAVLLLLPQPASCSTDDFSSEGPILLASFGSVPGNEAVGGQSETPEADEDIEEPATVSDPLFGWNRAMFTFNDRVYFWVFKPVARGYGAMVPEPARIGIRNFFNNLLMPVRFVNCLLQGKLEKAKNEIVRFSLNTTWGVLGFVDITNKYYHLPPQREDMGQTFAVWGIGNGFYLVWPFVGPSTLRDSFGLVGDYYLDPVSWVNPWELSVGIRVFDEINSTSLRIGDYEAFKAAALDPYVAMRDAYIQNRNKMIQE